MIGEYVLVRGPDSGVHVGFLKESNGRCCTLSQASQIFEWRGANTILEISLHGIDENSNITEQVATITIHDVCQTISCTEEAQRNLRRPRWKANV